ncbi:hypothetical protein LR004_01125 [Candidatus Gracilibacteria bacterium]|nr:hypothetical protein [Candidatus Gracilibacteria bacterium]
MFFVKLFYGILMIAMGAGIIKYRKQLKGWTGNWVWAEKYVGRGGTYFIMLLLGLGLIFLGVLYPFGILDRNNLSTVESKNQQILSE